MTHDTTQLTANNVPTAWIDVDLDLFQSDNVINLGTFRRPKGTIQAAASNAPIGFLSAEIEAPRRSVFVFETEPRPSPSGWSWKSAPKGVPIWGEFTVGMSHEDIRERFAMVEISGGALQGLCMLFGIEAHVTFEFDPEGGLDALLLDVECRDAAQAAETLNHLFTSWQGELHPTRFLGRVEERGELQGGNLHVDLYGLGLPRPGVLVCMRAVDPESYTVHYDDGAQA